jgi:hypothetical protein
VPKGNNAINILNIAVFQLRNCSLRHVLLDFSQFSTIVEVSMGQ